MTSANCNMAAAPLRELDPRTTEKPNRRTRLANQAPSRLALMRAAPCRCGIKRRMAKGSRRRRQECAHGDFPDRASNWPPTSLLTLPAERLRTGQPKLIENAPHYRIGDLVGIFGTTVKGWNGG